VERSALCGRRCGPAASRTWSGCCRKGSLCLNVQRGAIDEFKLPAYEEKVAELAQAGFDVINLSGAPPFMVLGYGQEQTLIRAWEKKYRTRIFTSGTSHIDALRALDVKRFLGATYLNRGRLRTLCEWADGSRAHRWKWPKSANSSSSEL
jgi:hypothetical protein